MNHDITQKMDVVRNTSSVPVVYQTYIENEIEWVSKSILGSKKLLDAGCGDGRLTEQLSKLTDHYVGIDYDEAAISKAKEQFSNNSNVEFFVKDLTDLGNEFSADTFDTSVCLWNTIGNIANEKKALLELHRVTSGRLFISFLKKGSLEYRKQYYESYGVAYRIDEKTETIYSDAWGFSKSYELEEFIKLCTSVGFKKVEVVELSPIAIGVVFAK